MAKIKNVVGEVLLQNYELQKKFNEFQRQINQKGGYPFDFNALMIHLQSSVDGIFMGIKNFSSKLFQKTTILKIKKCKGFEINQENIHSFLTLVYKKEKENGNSKISIDKDLWQYFQGQKVEGINKDFTGMIYRFPARLNHKQILDEAERTQIKRIYSFVEGLSIICEAILAGEVDKKGTGIIVYFEIEGVDMCRFRAFRSDDGELLVDVFAVSLDLGWGVVDGACFSN